MSEGRGSLPLDALVAWCRFITRDALAIPAVSPGDLAARRPTLVVARDYGDGMAYALVERLGDARWAVRWSSAYAGC